MTPTTRGRATKGRIVKRLATTLTLATAACVLLTSAAIAGAAKSPAPAAPALGPLPAGKGAPPRASAGIGETPPLYSVQESGGFIAAPFTQSRGTVACPAGTVVWGGGAFIFGTDIAVNINSSFPLSDGTGWVADVNNDDIFDALFVVDAVCAARPRLYRIRETGEITVGAVDHANGAEACTRRTVVLGGGSLSNSSSVGVAIRESSPVNGAWLTEQNDDEPFDTTFNVFAICGKAPAGYSKTGGGFGFLPPHTQTEAAVLCPSGHPLSGGALVSEDDPTTDLNTSHPIGSGWDVFQNNRTLDTAAIQPVVICA
jgi:hypothetical protein